MVSCMTKFRVLFLVSLMTVISGCCNGDNPDCDTALAGSKCIENVKKHLINLNIDFIFIPKNMASVLQTT